MVKTDMLATQAQEIQSLIANMSPAQRTLYETLYQRYSKLTVNAGKSAISTAHCAKVIEKALLDRRPRTRYRAGMDASLGCFLALTLNNKPLPPRLTRAKRRASPPIPSPAVP